MRIPLPRQLDARQLDADTRGLSLVAPSVSAPSSDDNATLVQLGDNEHAVPRDWTVAEARSGSYPLALLRRDSELKVLVGTIDGGVREIVGHSASTRRSILEMRFGEPSEQSSEQREVDRLVELSDSSTPASSGPDAAEVERLATLADTLDSSTSDDAEADRLAQLAREL